MINVTVSMDEDTARWVRVEAAKAGKSVSRWLGEILAERRAGGDRYDQAARGFLERGAYTGSHVDQGADRGKSRRRKRPSRS